MRFKTSLLNRFRLEPKMSLFLSFFLAILLGTYLLWKLPVSREPISPIDALFTSTSAVCVTGLIVKNTPLFFNFRGQLIILILIQLGGLGIMTFYAAGLAYLKKMSKRTEYMMQQLLEDEGMSRIKETLNFVLKFTILAELLGTLLLFLAWRDLPVSRTRLLWLSCFHSVSAFCNAGFSLFPDNLEGFIHAPFTLTVIAILVAVGGIGFVAVEDLANKFAHPKNARLKLHTRIVLKTSLFLVSAGFLFFYFYEASHLPAGDRWAAALFHSVTPRTAGFNVLGMGSFSATGLLFTIFLMIIGASPGGTGGGIKTTTFFISLKKIWSTLKGETSVSVNKRKISEATISKSLTIFMTYL